MPKSYHNRIATALQFLPAASAAVCIVRDTYNRKNGSAEPSVSGSHRSRSPYFGMMAEGVGNCTPTSAATWWKSEQCLRGDNSVGSARGMTSEAIRLDSVGHG